MGFIKLESNRKYRVDEVLYQIGKIAWLPFCMAGIWFSHSGYEYMGEWMGCFIRRTCGLPCPGCGGTRAFYYLFQGNLIKSFQLNPTVLYGVLAYLHFMVFYFYRSHVSGTIQEKEIRIEVYMYAAIVILLVQWAVKIIYIFFLFLT